MPPRSYLVTAAALVALVAISLPLTMGFAIIAWYWLFAAVACVLFVVGVIRIVYGLRAPIWIGVALASPGVLWAADNLLNMTNYRPMSVAWILATGIANSFAFLAAAVAALRLSEILSRPHAVFRIGYAMLAISAVLSGTTMIAYFMGWNFSRDPLYMAWVRPFQVAVTLVRYGAFVGAAIMIVTRYDMERWISVAVILVGLHMLSEIVGSMVFGGFGGGMMFWLQPVLLLVSAAAVWRIGTLLRGQLAPRQA